MNARSGIRFHVRDRDIEVDIAAVDAIRAELEKIAATNPPRGDIEGLVEALKIHEIDLGVEVDARSPTFTLDYRRDLDQRWRVLLLRATDHLRNLKHEGDVLELRKALCNPGQSTSYRLRDIKHVEAFDFTSYSGPYSKDDRLVDCKGNEWRIVNVVYASDPVELKVEARRPAE